MDTTDIRAQTAEIQKIGVNVNQIAKRLNSMGPVYAQDIEDRHLQVMLRRANIRCQDVTN